MTVTLERTTTDLDRALQAVDVLENDFDAHGGPVLAGMLRDAVAQAEEDGTRLSAPMQHVTNSVLNAGQTETEEDNAGDEPGDEQDADGETA